MKKAVKKEETKEKVVRLTLPIPEGIHIALMQMSKEEERSLTSQIIYILKNAIQEEKK